MDHLPPILDPVEPYPKPPFLGYICTFDGGQFTTFPERCGWKLEGENNFSDRLLRKDGVELGHLETSAFIQAWLFFGLLFEVFKIIDVPLDEEHFIRKDDTGTSVTTQMLPTYIKKWEEREHSRSSSVQKQHLRGVLSHLQEAGGIVDTLLSHPRLRYAADELTMTRLVIAESIAILGDTLMNATKNIWRREKQEMESLVRFQFRKRLRFCEPATLSLKRLEHRGWCKSSRMMMHRLVDSTGLCYAGMLTRPNMQANHEMCSIQECTAMHVQSSTYSTRHVSDACSCTNKLIDRERVAELIRQGRTPCVRFDAESGDVELIASDKEDYVAFSHVWAHGLGNPAVNGLPQCQLKRLQDLATIVRRKRESLDTTEKYLKHDSDRQPVFWIDTLCIPVGDEDAYKSARNTAIRNLTRIFSEASVVLVVDAELQAAHVYAHSLEREIRMITCDWMRRVWTLQEALLTQPKNLFWQFKEDALSAEEIWQDYFDQAPCHISYRTSAFDKRLPYFSGNTKSPSDLSNNFLELVYALRYRSLSRVEDETICMAPILGLDRAPLLNQEEHVQRMQMFFRLWQNIPSYILFMEGERLSQPGSRWMPLSFVRGAHKTTVTRVSPQFTTFEPRGLLVSYPGLILPVSDARLAEYCDVGFWNRFDSKWYRIRDTSPVFESKLPTEQRWSHWKPILSTFHHPAFVLEYPSDYSHNYIVAVLVDITEEANGLNYADFKARVWLDECNTDRRFETQSETDSVEIWLEGMYREHHGSDSNKARPGAQGGYLPPKDAFHTTTLQQRWCIG